MPTSRNYPRISISIHFSRLVVYDFTTNMERNKNAVSDPKSLQVSCLSCRCLGTRTTRMRNRAWGDDVLIAIPLRPVVPSLPSDLHPTTVTLSLVTKPINRCVIAMNNIDYSNEFQTNSNCECTLTIETARFGGRQRCDNYNVSDSRDILVNNYCYCISCSH